ncbi:unnamed protein product [Paramecium octaurelia]|uniref:Uncharacterized protein n=1 Tax=Paramecium octaurelia TaxID=43137 RepID=A0A8S1WDK0_PAROT|nr:unnamed protein product [Paramecium octaurelia]
MQYDRSLLTEDIIGAQPKHRNVYMNRLLPNQLTQEEQIRLQKQMPPQDIRFGRRRYENDIHHFCNIRLPSENQYFDKRNKKNNDFPKGDVKQHMAFGNYPDQSKLLNTKDIDGAVPGSLQSQAVRNQEIARKLRSERERQNKSCNPTQIEEITKEESQQYSGRDRSHTFQTNYCQRNSEKSPQLPPIPEKISDTVDHVANKLQLRQPRKSFQFEDFRQKNKQALLRLYV